MLRTSAMTSTSSHRASCCELLSCGRVLASTFSSGIELHAKRARRGC